MAEQLGVLEDCLWVMDRAKSVKIDRASVTVLANDLLNQGIQRPPWDDIAYWQGRPAEMAQYALVLECLNFMSWNPDVENRWFYIDEYGKEWSGWYGTVMAVNEDLKKSKRLLDADSLQHLSLDDFKMIFLGKGELMLVEERVAHLREVGEVLMRDFGGQFGNVLSVCNYDAVVFVNTCVGLFSNFRDVSYYETGTVRFYKRAQHLAIMVWSLLQKQGGRNLSRMEELTLLADNRVPQFLRHAGVLVYAEGLVRVVDGQVILESGSVEEIEIRAAAVVAGEMLRVELERHGEKLMAVELDVNIWLMAEKLKGVMKPAHRVVSVNY